ncbi:hypothetical protein SY94_2330 [Agrobacterium tumefaciens]|nr:hypothetical protein SY94_2330 [Agrobacterium tumefaciens]
MEIALILRCIKTGKRQYIRKGQPALKEQCYFMLYILW